MTGNDWRVLSSAKDRERVERARRAGHKVSLWHGESATLYKIIRRRQSVAGRR